MKGRRSILAQRAGARTRRTLRRVAEFRDIQTAGENRAGQRQYSRERNEKRKL